MTNPKTEKPETVKPPQNVITDDTDKNFKVTAFIPVRVKTYRGRSID